MVEMKNDLVGIIGSRCASGYLGLGAILMVVCSTLMAIVIAPMTILHVLIQSYVRRRLCFGSDRYRAMCSSSTLGVSRLRPPCPSAQPMHSANRYMASQDQNDAYARRADLHHAGALLCLLFRVDPNALTVVCPAVAIVRRLLHYSVRTSSHARCRELSTHTERHARSGRPMRDGEPEWAIRTSTGRRPTRYAIYNEPKWPWCSSACCCIRPF